MEVDRREVPLYVSSFMLFCVRESGGGGGVGIVRRSAWIFSGCGWKKKNLKLSEVSLLNPILFFPLNRIRAF